MPTLTWKYDGFVNSEGPGVLIGTTTCSTTATVTAAGNIASPAGDYPITCSGQTGRELRRQVRRWHAQSDQGGRVDRVHGRHARDARQRAARPASRSRARSARRPTARSATKLTTHVAGVHGLQVVRHDAVVARGACTAAVTATGAAPGPAQLHVSLGEDNYVVKIQLVTNGYYTAPVRTPSPRW